MNRSPSSPPRSLGVRGRIVAAVVACALVAALAALLAGDPGERIASGIAVVEEDPFAFEQDRADEFLERGRRGLAHVLYALSPGGVEATSERTLSFEDEIRAAARREGVRSSTLEALVFLESAGRPEVVAGPNPASASGLAQILPQTATDLLGMTVELGRSKRLTARIARQERRAARPDEPGELTKAKHRIRMLLRQRRRIDERFDPPAALSGAARYLALAEDRFGREDLATTSYHMGIGNLDRVIATYLSPEPVTGGTRAAVEQHGLSYAQLYFDSSPVRNPRTYALLRELGDDSRHYLFKLEAAREIIRLYREDRPELRRLDRLHGNKASAEEVLRPPADTERFDDPEALHEAYDDGELVQLRSNRSLGYRIDPEMGELAPQLEESPVLYRGLRPEALAAVVYVARQVRAATGRETTLTLTSSVRDTGYQELLRGSNPEATAGYSLHTTGFAFDLARDLGAGGEGALVAALERLRALDVLDWVYEAGSIHVTVGPDAGLLLADPGLL